jgi:hypothetical protein
VLLLGGRSWQVVEVDWPRRRVSVTPAMGGGGSRWLGGSRTLSARVCHAAERIVAGAAPGCALSRRAEARLAEVRVRLAFVDGRSLPVVADRGNQVRVWLFAGGLASASFERALAQSGLASTRWDDFSWFSHARRGWRLPPSPVGAGTTAPNLTPYSDPEFLSRFWASPSPGRSLSSGRAKRGPRGRGRAACYPRFAGAEPAPFFPSPGSRLRPYG